MIIKKDKQVELRFGNGDICIAGGYSEDEDTINGLVVFKDQEPREIGIAGDIKEGFVDLEDYPVIMAFTKKESIDVLIEQLEIAKELMD